MKKDLKNKKREFVILLAQGNITYFLASNTLSHYKVQLRRNGILDAKYFVISVEKYSLPITTVLVIQ